MLVLQPYGELVQFQREQRNMRKNTQITNNKKDTQKRDNQKSHLKNSVNKMIFFLILGEAIFPQYIDNTLLFNKIY